MASVRPLQVLAATLSLATAAFLLPHPTAVQASSADVSAPEYVSAHVTPLTADVSTAPVAITASVRLTDQTAVASLYLNLEHSASGQSFTQYATRTSGTAQNGVWTGRFELPQGAAPGSWAVRMFSVTDTLGNRSSGFTQIRSIQVQSVVAPDVSAPSLVSSHVTPLSVSVADAPAVITASVRLADETAVSSLYLNLEHSSSGQSFTQYAVLSSGTRQNGVWTGRFELPRGAAGGVWG